MSERKKDIKVGRSELCFFIDKYSTNKWFHLAFLIEYIDTYIYIYNYYRSLK